MEDHKDALLDLLDAADISFEETDYSVDVPTDEGYVVRFFFSEEGELQEIGVDE